MSDSIIANEPDAPSMSSSLPTVVPHEDEKVVCRECVHVLDAGDNFCRFCGSPTLRGEALLGSQPQAATRAGSRSAKPSWIESPVVVLLALFFFLGPLALPMLWRSRCFNQAWKIGLTIVILAFTVAVCWYAYQAVAKELAQINLLLR